MRFSLQDVKKSISRRGGELSVSLHFLRQDELNGEIEQLIAYHERLLGQPQRLFSLDDARAFVGDYRLAHCLLATLSHWYLWQARDWSTVLQALGGSDDLAMLSSSVQLRLALYTYVNEHHHGFLDTQTRMAALDAFAALYSIRVTDLEYLLTLDTEEETLLVRDAAQPPTAAEVVSLYNQWVFEAALFNASNVHFVLDCNAFATTPQATNLFAQPTIGMGVGAMIKRLCFLARRMGVYYDLAYENTLSGTLLHLALYGPQDVTGAPQQYGLRLARLCRLLLDYGTPKGPNDYTKKKARSASLSLVKEADATVHFLQRAYNFRMDARLLSLLPGTADASQGNANNDSSVLFDSGIEQSFSEAFASLASRQGVDGWRLEREPEPLLLDSSIFIPDFAFTRRQQRIYVEILGFWTPSYRERKIQKLQQLRDRRDLLLAIPVEAKDAFASISDDFPIVIYNGQLSATEVLQALRSHYDDFAERLALIAVQEVQARVKQDGLLPEQLCYEVLHCYRRSEIPQAAECILNEDIQFMPGIGLYSRPWLSELQTSFMDWMRTVRSAALDDVGQVIRERWSVLANCDNATIEALLTLWSEIHVKRDSIFDAVVELAENSQASTNVPDSSDATTRSPVIESAPEPKNSTRAKRSTTKKRVMRERDTTQGDLWQ